MKSSDTESVFGGSSTASRLALMLESDKIPHALLIAGPAGVGKRTAAMAFAKAVMCPHRQGPLACGRCRVCTSFDAKTNPDATIVESEKSIGVDAVRALRAGAFASPVSAKRRIFIITNAQSMTVSAQNALLKLFEEPASQLVIILTAISPESLLPTVLSRAVTIYMPLLSDGEMREFLTKKYTNATSDKIEAAVRLSGGAIGSAITIMRKRTDVADFGQSAAEFLKKGEKYKFLSLANKISATRDEFLCTCDSLVRAGANGLAAGDIPPCAAAALVHTTEKYRRSADGPAALPLLVTAMMLEIWRESYDDGLRSTL